MGLSVSTETAEKIAKIVADIKKGRVRDQFNFERTQLIRQIMQSAVAVDSTQVYYDLVDREKGVFIYEDHVVRPVWEQSSGRVTGFEILPASVLDRPRIDVTLRISGFFRDAFPGLIDLFDSAARAVAPWWPDQCIDTLKTLIEGG